MNKVKIIEVNKSNISFFVNLGYELRKYTDGTFVLRKEHMTYCEGAMFCIINNDLYFLELVKEEVGK